MASRSFLTNHARTLLCIAHDPGVRFRDIAVEVGITERRAHGIVADLVDAGYLVKQKTGRRNPYRIQAHLPLRVTRTREPTIGEMLDVLVGATPAAENTRLAGFTMADSPRSNTCRPRPRERSPAQARQLLERRVGGRHQTHRTTRHSRHRSSLGVAAAAGNCFVGDDPPSNGGDP